MIMRTDMNFMALVRDVAQRTGLTQDDARTAVLAVMDSIGHTVAEGGRVRLNNFGSFEKVVRIVGPNPITPAPKEVARVRFTATGRLKESLDSGTFLTLERSPKSVR
jgi:nucleoid DNA-binding protein